MRLTAPPCNTKKYTRQAACNRPYYKPSVLKRVTLKRRRR